MATLLSGFYSGVRLSEIQEKPFLEGIIAHASVPHPTTHRYNLRSLNA